MSVVSLVNNIKILLLCFSSPRNRRSSKEKRSDGIHADYQMIDDVTEFILVEVEEFVEHGGT